MSVNAIRAGKAFIELDAHVTPLQNSMKRAAKDVASFSRSVKQATGSMQACFGALSPAINQISPSLNLLAVGLNTFTLNVGGAATGIRALFGLMTANPLGIFITAFAAAGACIGGIMYSLRDTTTEAERNIQACERESSALKNLRERSGLYGKTLELLSEKETLSSSEREIAIKTINALSSEYGNLGIVIDSTTGKISGVTQGIAAMNDMLAKREEEALDREISARRLRIQNLRDQKKGAWTDGGRRELTDQIRAEQVKLRSAKNARIQKDIDKLESEKEQREASRQRVEGAEKELASFDRSKMTDGERRRHDLSEEIKKRRALYDVIIKELKAKKFLSESERERLRSAESGKKKLKSEYARRKKEIEEDEAAEESAAQEKVDKIGDAASDFRKERNEQRQRERETQEWESLKTTDVLGARKKAEEALGAKKTLAQEAYTAYGRKFVDLSVDGDISEKDQEELTAILDRYRDLESEVDTWQGRLDDLRIGGLKGSSAMSLPSVLSSQLSGTASAQQKFLENRNAMYDPMEQTNALLKEQVVLMKEQNGNLQGV